MTDSALIGRALACAAACAAALLATATHARGAADEAPLRIVVVPERTYVEPWPEQVGLYDRVSLHLAVINDTADEILLDRVRFSFRGAAGCGYQLTLSRDALARRLQECASAVFVAPEVRERRKLATESRLPAGGVAALIGNQFDLPAAIEASQAIVEIRARAGAGRERTLRAEIKLWRYRPTTRFQFPYEGVWMMANGHGPGPGHPVDSFAYDFVKVRGLSTHEGDGREFGQWWGYGAPIAAAADGVVVEANQAEGRSDNPPLGPLPSGEELGLTTEITNTLVTVDRDGVHYRPGNVDWESLSAEDRARVNGCYAVIRHGDEEFSLYVHLQPGSLVVKQGDRVKAGQVIGKCGSSGHSNAPGLHFQVLYKPDMHAGLPVAFTPAGAPEMSPLRLIVFGSYAN